MRIPCGLRNLIVSTPLQVMCRWLRCFACVRCSYRRHVTATCEIHSANSFHLDVHVIIARRLTFDEIGIFCGSAFVMSVRSSLGACLCFCLFFPPFLFHFANDFLSARQTPYFFLPNRLSFRRSPSLGNWWAPTSWIYRANKVLNGSQPPCHWSLRALLPFQVSLASLFCLENSKCITFKKKLIFVETFSVESPNTVEIIYINIFSKWCWFSAVLGIKRKLYGKMAYVSIYKDEYYRYNIHPI